MKITHAESFALNIPFYAKRVTRAMQRAQTHDERVWVVRLETDNGLVGWADSHGRPETKGLVGQNPAAIMHRDEIGFGPQVACYDLVGQDQGVPVHALLGVKLRDRCPISWWDIDMPAADWAAEAKESLKRGYTTFKMKARPWRDIIAQTNAVSKVVPEDYKFDVDFNGFLLNQARAEIVLQKLDENRNVGIYESPFYMHLDVDGARLLRERVRKPIVEHYQDQYLRNDCSDGFVLGGGATDTRRQATAGQDGYMPVPDTPGLGAPVDEKAIAKYRVDPDEPTPKQCYRAQKRILRVNWPAGGRKKRVWEFTDEGNYQTSFYAGNIPGFETGVDLEVIEDDKSAAFKKRHAQLLQQGR